MLEIDLMDQLNAEVTDGECGSDAVHFGRYLWFRKYILPPPATLLDVGCHTYMLTCACFGDVKEKTKLVLDGLLCGVDFRGVDVLDSAIRDNRLNKAGTVKCRVGKEKLPFSECAFNTVLLGEVLEHIPRVDWPFALRECIRVAKNQVLISVPIKHMQFQPGADDDPEAHSWEPTSEELCEEVLKQVRPAHSFKFEQLLHLPNKGPARNVGFNYIRIIRKEWW